MRIISGRAGGRKLHSFRGRSIRPTPDRVREAIFSALQSRLGHFDGLAVLDLFAGTGALGIEALSRGAEGAVFVEQDPRAAGLVRTNLAGCRLESGAEVLVGRIPDILERLAGRGPFDLVFLDPPYGRDLAPPTLAALLRLELLAPDGLVCVETGRDEPLAQNQGALERLTLRTYGSTAVHLFALPAAEDQPR